MFFINYTCDTVPTISTNFHSLFPSTVLSTIPNTNGSKIPFTPLKDRFCEDNFLRYLGLCYVNPHI